MGFKQAATWLSYHLLELPGGCLYSTGCDFSCNCSHVLEACCRLPGPSLWQRPATLYEPCMTHEPVRSFILTWVQGTGKGSCFLTIPTITSWSFVCQPSVRVGLLERLLLRGHVLQNGYWEYHRWRQPPKVGRTAAAHLGRPHGLCLLLWKRWGRALQHKGSAREGHFVCRDGQRAAICPLCCTPSCRLKPQVLAFL